MYTWCLRPKVKIKKIYWEFHKGDADFNPSMPHGHSLDGKYKLELWSGNIYDVKTKELCWIANPKEMQQLYSYEEFLEFVVDCRSEYIKSHPNFNLPPLSALPTSKSSKHLSIRKHQSKKYKNNISFLFEIKCEKIDIKNEK